MKTLPKVGDHLYLRQFTSDYCIDLVKRPFTVIAVTPTKVVVQAARCIFPVFHYDPKTMSPYYKQFDGKETCFFDTVAESFEEDHYGRIEELTWHSRRQLWGTAGRDSDYPQYAIFDEGWKHFPYLN